MTYYPIKVEPLRFYNGTEPKKLQRFHRDMETARRIEDYINRKAEQWFRDGDFAMILFGEIAAELNLPTRRVENYLYKFSGSSNNSIEIRKPPVAVG